MIVCKVGDLVVPLVCKRCGHRELVIVGDEVSEQAAENGMAGHQCKPAEKERAS